MTGTIKLDMSLFSEERPTKAGTYAARRKPAASGFSQAQVVRVLDNMFVIGPGWPRALPITSLNFLWGPKIEIQVDKDQWY